MATYTKSLYQKIFEEYANRFTQLRVISGYGSSKFLKKVIKEFPHLNVQLFLGMTAEGVSFENHNGYLLTCSQRDQTEVFYQITGVSNHMKILEFSNGYDKKIFIGSANFTENGFIYQREIMTEIADNLDFLFAEQMNQSLACTEKNIGDFINFYTEQEKPFEQQKEIEDGTIDNLDELNTVVTDNLAAATTILDKQNIYYNKLILLKKRIDFGYYNRFALPIVLPSSSNHRWASTGINAWKEQKKPVLEQPSKLLFKNIFPEGEEFKIYTDDDLIFYAKLSGKFNRQLELLNGDLYRYILERLELEENQPICYEDLLEKNQTLLYFERINFSEFYMSFSEI